MNSDRMQLLADDFAKGRSVLQLLENHPEITIVKIDARLRAEYVSPSMEQILGYSPDYFVGKSVMEVVHQDDIEKLRSQVGDTIEAKRETLESEYRVRTEANETVWMETKARLFYDSSGEFDGAVYVQSDVTKRKLQEQQLKATLQEKDDLMKELNHRVKNNLAMVSALIGLKSSETGDDLSDLQHQIDAIKLIHEKLYQSNSVSQIDCGDYVGSLVHSIVSSFATRSVRIEVDIEDCQIAPKAATTLGLIINELVVNAIKYGFSDVQEPLLRVEMTYDTEEKQYRFSLLNTGRAFPEEIDLDGSGTMGLQLVSALTLQLDGTVSLQKDPFPKFEITFPGSNA